MLLDAISTTVADRRIRVLGLTFVFVVLMVTAGARAGAHSGIQSYVYLSITEDSMEGRVEYPAADLGEVLDIDLPSEIGALREAAVANGERIRAYTDEHLAMGDGNAEWELSFVDDPGAIPAVGGYVTVPFTVVETFDGAPRTFEVDYDGIFHDNPERDALLLIENDWGTARFDNEGDHLLGFSIGMTARTVQLDNVSTLRSMIGARGLGTKEVRGQADHLLFVVALLLPVGLVATGASVRDPAPTILHAIRRGLRLLAMFAASHSVVLWMIGLSAIDVPSDVARTLAAVSLLLMAIFAIRPFAAGEVSVVAALGALQGVGLGRAFVERGLADYDLPALIAFTIGIQVSVVVITALVLPLLLLLRRTIAAGPALWGGAVLIGAYAGVSLIERILGPDLQADWVAAQLRQWPRNLWLMLLVWSAAGAIAWWSAQTGRQRPVAGSKRISPTTAPEPEMMTQ